MNVPVSDLIAEYGSPLYVFSEATLRRAYQQAHQAFKRLYPDVQFAWSYKTNYLKAICSLFHQEGAIAEVVSDFEYEKARNLGVAGRDIIFNGPHKSPIILQRAIEEGARIHIDNLEELLLVDNLAGKTGKRVDVGIRVFMDCGVRPVWSKFGFNADNGDAIQAIKRIHGSRNLRLTGLHTHVGTYILDPEIYTRATKTLLEIAAIADREYGFTIDYLDLGGGFASRSQLHMHYLPPENVVPSMDAYAEAICRPILSAWPKDRKLPRLYLESGRALVDEAGYLISSIVAFKQDVEPTAARSRPANLEARAKSGQPTMRLCSRQCRLPRRCGRQSALYVDLVSLQRPARAPRRRTAERQDALRLPVHEHRRPRPECPLTGSEYRGSTRLPSGRSLQHHAIDAVHHLSPTCRAGDERTRSKRHSRARYSGICRGARTLAGAVEKPHIDGKWSRPMTRTTSVLGTLEAELRSLIEPVLNAYAIIYFARRPALGLVLLAITFLCPLFGLFGLAGVLIALVGARFFGFSAAGLRNGELLYNSLLTSLGLAYLTSVQPIAAPLLIALLATVSLATLFLTVALGQMTRQLLGLPILSTPFVLMTGLLYLLFYAFTGTPIVGSLPTGILPEPTFLPEILASFFRSLAASLWVPLASRRSDSVRSIGLALPSDGAAGGVRFRGGHAVYAPDRTVDERLRRRLVGHLLHLLRHRPGRHLFRGELAHRGSVDYGRRCLCSHCDRLTSISVAIQHPAAVAAQRVSSSSRRSIFCDAARIRSGSMKAPISRSRPR